MAKISVVFAVCLGVRAACAQAEISEDALLRALSPDHPALVALSANVGDAEAAVARARALSNPEIALAIEAPRDLSTQTMWSLAWQPPLDGRRALRIDAAQAHAAAVRHELAAARLRLRLEVRAAHADWAAAWQRRDLVAAHVVVVERLARKVRARADAGEVAGLSARRLELAVAEERAERARAEAVLIRVNAAVRALFPQLPKDARPGVSALPASAIRVEPGAGAYVQARLLEVRRSEIELVEARRFFVFPTLDLGWQRVEQTGFQWSGPAFGLAWTIPIFDRRRGDRLATTQRLEAARASAELATLRSTADAEGAGASYEVLRDAATTAAASVGEGDSLIEGAQAAYDLGEADTTDLLETLRSVLRTRLTAVELHADALAAHRALEAASGLPLLPTDGDDR